MTDPGPVEPRPSSAVPAGPSEWAAPSPWEPPQRQGQPAPAGYAVPPAPPAASAQPPSAQPPSAQPPSAQQPLESAQPPPPVDLTQPPPVPTGPPYQVPTGPGVALPFAAPPVEGRTARVWIGLGVAALAVMLCCGGGTVALVGLIVTGTEAVNEQARVAVDDYFEAVSLQNFGAAYGMLCAEAQRRESSDEFAERLTEEPEVDSYSVGQVSVTSRIVVPVEVTYSDGGSDTLRVSLNQDTGTGELEVCGIEE